MSAVAQEAIKEGSQLVAAIGKNDRTLFVGIMLSILIFVGFLTFSTNENQREQRDAFLSAMEKRDTKFSESMDRNSEALRRNTEATIEIKSLIR